MRHWRQKLTKSASNQQAIEEFCYLIIRPRLGDIFMAGHSKWANTKHRKAAQDAKRGKDFH